jgi:hypothetical protein
VRDVGKRAPIRKAERAENAIVVSPTAESADVIEPDDCDGELV